MTRWRFRRSALVPVAMLLGLAASAPGQEQPATFEFTFSNPGARSMALGGAFAALADDATAAFANPAGLVQLIDPEISVEARASSRDTRFVQGGRVSGRPSGEGVDTVDGLRYGVSKSDQFRLPFASFVYPAKRWSFALYRHSYADFELASQIDGLFGVEDGEEARAGDIRSRIGVKVVNNGVATAYEITDNLSVGLGIVYYEAQMNAFAEEFAQDEDEFYQRSDFAADRLDTTYSHQATARDMSLNAGFLWRASPRWAIGGYYRQGPRLELRVVETTGPADEEVPPGTIALDTRSPLRLPDVFGLGLAYRSANGAWTLGAEWAHVGYSSITDGLDVDVLDPNQIVLSDGDELHLGLEHVFSRTRPIVALRLGAWLDPAHRVVAGQDADLFERAVFQGASDEVHVTGGLGLAFGTFQLDLGVDRSDRSTLVSLSLVYRL